MKQYKGSESGIGDMELYELMLENLAERIDEIEEKLDRLEAILKRRFSPLAPN